MRWVEYIARKVNMQFIQNFSWKTERKERILWRVLLFMYNDREMGCCAMQISGQWLGKNVPAVRKNSISERTVFSTRSALRSYKEEN
jgi:hypothetical protein